MFSGVVDKNLTVFSKQFIQLKSVVINVNVKQIFLAV